MTRRGAIGLGMVGLATAGFLLAQPAFAADYPSWDDVERARADEGAKAAEITRIQGLIAELQAEVARTQAVAQQLAGEYMQAQEEFYSAADRANLLQLQADAESAKAVAAAEKAGRIASQLYRNGGDDTSLELFFSGSAAGADDLLARLGAMDKVMGVNRAVYDEAVTARDTAQSLSDQAVVARDERDRLQKIAEQKMIAAQEAANAAQAAAEAAAMHLTELQAQLAALQDTTAKTVAAYQEGVEAERRAREAREAAAREEAARRAAEQAAQAAQAGSSVSAGGGSSSGSGGWTRPHGGYVSDTYGPRSSICSNGYCTSGYHRGTDLANGCGAEIYAANSGRVSLLLWNDPGYGNMIKIDHGNGYGTGYAHIRPGGFNVNWGDYVASGQVIAYAGTTGASTGCHLHFEVYVNGATTDPQSFMASQGVWL
ncbi:M23 family metallopeptidase [Microbacterium sp.]|uniref:M23 family metallopeptidase n=1 Tax=Microbacterium sp. TaxID=51671 RepID=UPI0039E268E7